MADRNAPSGPPAQPAKRSKNFKPGNAVNTSQQIEQTLQQLEGRKADDMEQEHEIGMSGALSVMWTRIGNPES